jgi:GNAT superfamily N-acetyltransferase
VSGALPLVIRFAETQESRRVSAVLLEAAEWLRARGEELWDPAQLEAGMIAGDVALGRYLLALSGDLVVGTARLTAEDEPFWPEARDGEALYIHRLAVRRTHAGAGVSAALLEWCLRRATQLGREYLRLDCDAQRARLRRVYEDFGFEYHSDQVVGRYTVARYQKRAR